jgi:eukaryotic-like serine/threonine-protein kinase
MTAILKQELPDLPDSVPSGVRQIVHHCLEKDRVNRFQSARDLSFALSAMSPGAIDFKCLRRYRVEMQPGGYIPV